MLRAALFVWAAFTVAAAITPPLLDAEWGSMFDNIWSDLDANVTIEVAGWSYSSNAAQCTQAEWAAGGDYPYSAVVVDNFTANVANVMNVTGQSCSVTGTEGSLFQGPAIMQELGFQYNGTTNVGLMGDTIAVDNWVVALPDDPNHKDQVYTVLLRAGTNQLVLYQVSLREAPPSALDTGSMAARMHSSRVLGARYTPVGAATAAPTLHRVLTQNWYHGYAPRTTPWPPGFFNASCPW